MVARDHAPIGFWGPAPQRLHGAQPLSASRAQPLGLQHRLWAGTDGGTVMTVRNSGGNGPQPRC